MDLAILKGRSALLFCFDFDPDIGLAYGYHAPTKLAKGRVLSLSWNGRGRPQTGKRYKLTAPLRDGTYLVHQDEAGEAVRLADPLFLDVLERQ